MERCSASALGSASPWIAVNTSPHRERIVLERLQRQALTACCPMIRKQRSHARRVATALRPLFPVLLHVMHRGIEVRLGGDIATPASGSL